MRGVLVDPSAARPNSVKILQSEVVSLARPVAARFVEPQLARFEEAGKPLRLVDGRTPPELRYFLDPDAANELLAAWRIGVRTYNPPDDLEVLIDAETGRFWVSRASWNIGLHRQHAPALHFACAMDSMHEESCSRTALNPVELMYDGTRGCVADKKRCGKAQFRTPWETADDATDHVKGMANGAFLEGVGGSDCTIDIVVCNDSFLSKVTISQPWLAWQAGASPPGTLLPLG